MHKVAKATFGKDDDEKRRRCCCGKENKVAPEPSPNGKTRSDKEIVKTQQATTRTEYSLPREDDIEAPRKG